MIVRDAVEGDAEALARLIGQLGYPTTAASVSRRLRRLEDSDADRVFVADLDGVVVGLAGVHVSPSLEHERDAAKVSAIVVDESQRRRGIGAALMARVEVEARERDCCVLFLTTAERRSAAHRFYRRLGLVETGRRFAKPLQ